MACPGLGWLEQWAELLAAVSGGAELADLCHALFCSEFGHYKVFLKLARKIADKAAMEARWQQMLASEAQILAREVPGPRIHSGDSGV